MAMTDHVVCSSPGAQSLERTRFFPRQLVTPDDLTQDQEYLRAKARRHNRLLHGWGVVCGARVKNGPEPSEIVIEQGYILGPYGDEIVIDRDVTVDLCRESLDGDASIVDAVDPWCSDVRVGRPSGRPVYVAVRYADCRSRPVRAYPVGCGCEESECEYSRIRDSFAVKVLTRLPSTYDPMPPTSLTDSVTCRRRGDEAERPCPPCPTEPWVILADVMLGTDCRVIDIDCFTHRRFVASFADYYFLCRPDTDPQPDHNIIVGPANPPG